MSEVQNVDVEQVWKSLAEIEESQLVDVRSKAEWTFVGLPDLSPLNKKTILIEWQSFPTMQTNDSFCEELAIHLEGLNLDLSAPLYFLCRSGARSLAAAEAATANGHAQAYNVKHGFEGVLNDLRHRNHLNGWRAKGLPWIQS